MIDHHWDALTASCTPENKVSLRCVEALRKAAFSTPSSGTWNFRGKKSVIDRSRGGTAVTPRDRFRKILKGASLTAPGPNEGLRPRRSVREAEAVLAD